MERNHLSVRNAEEASPKVRICLNMYVLIVLAQSLFPLGLRSTNPATHRCVYIQEKDLMLATSPAVASLLPEQISWLGILPHTQKELNKEWMKRGAIAPSIRTEASERWTTQDLILLLDRSILAACTLFDYTMMYLII